MRTLRLTLLLAAAALAVPAAAPAQTAQPAQGISVVGESEAFADNDTGTFRFGVSARRKTAAAALRSTSAAVQRVSGAARATGVARGDIQTDVVSVQRETSRRRGTTWVARNAVRVTIRKLADAGTLVDRAVGAGATSVDGPELGVADVKELYRRTLAQAFADARAKAEALAAQAGVRVGAPIRIRESGADAFEESLASLVQETAGDDESSGGGSGGGSTVEGGRSRVTASVNVTFAVVSP